MTFLFLPRYKMSIIITVMTILCLGTMLPPGDCSNLYSARIDKYGESMTLTCTEREDVTFDHWVLPDVHTIVEWPYSDHQMELLANKSLYFASVEKEHLGDYICRVIDNNTSEPVYYRTTLYLYVQTLWETYHHNVIVGCSASGVVLVLLTFICTIDRCRYSTRQQSKKEKEQQWRDELAEEVEMSRSDTSQGVVNNACERGKYLAPDGSLVINTEQL
jgi:hypothetical protein